MNRKKSDTLKKVILYIKPYLFLLILQMNLPTKSEYFVSNIVTVFIDIFSINATSFP